MENENNASQISVAFLGTPEIATETLVSLAQSTIIDCKYVITQPDKAVGRKQIITPPPVKVTAEKLGIKVFQPHSKTDLEKVLQESTVDFLVVFAYGMILSEKALKAPQISAINIHTSLLPKYRGASPIQNAILHGDSTSGITFIEMNSKMDQGDIYHQLTIPIETNENSESLSKKMSSLSSLNIVELLQQIKHHKLKPTKQDHSQATYCKKITKQDGKIDFTKSAQEIINMLNAYTPWPGIFTTFKGKKLKILNASSEANPETTTHIPAGTFFSEDKTLKISTNNGYIIPTTVQQEGKTAINSRDFLNGNPDIMKI